ncbi:uncharacterized protein B0I36DRAFT_96309 [Microdochium trichocladiopsis]|uniref:Uncharacterized protein n=1 Tax=Microdochium trichocladiopsis TaxID=1682393 RepID=A0A9P8YD41_9PEZI|nr:uncharacterized protein B0I36DRAFT_96309 [Microdochium trichocladiopsis]KAH7035740.1 hypothetical protein B0I36DRAFT_96309 [Microdochium trichocladiopsis]
MLAGASGFRRPGRPLDAFLCRWLLWSFPRPALSQLRGRELSALEATGQKDWTTSCRNTAQNNSKEGLVQRVGHSCLHCQVFFGWEPPSTREFQSLPASTLPNHDRTPVSGPAVGDVDKRVSACCRASGHGSRVGQHTFGQHTRHSRGTFVAPGQGWPDSFSAARLSARCLPACLLLPDLLLLACVSGGSHRFCDLDAWSVHKHSLLVRDHAGTRITCLWALLSSGRFLQQWVSRGHRSWHGAGQRLKALKHSRQMSEHLVSSCMAIPGTCPAVTIPGQHPKGHVRAHGNSRSGQVRAYPRARDRPRGSDGVSSRNLRQLASQTEEKPQDLWLRHLVTMGRCGFVRTAMMCKSGLQRTVP